MNDFETVPVGTMAEIESQATEIARLRGVLESIAACKDMTLLGCSPDNIYMETSTADEERAHQYGANKAFNECATTAKAALKETREPKPGEIDEHFAAEHCEALKEIVALFGTE